MNDVNRILMGIAGILVILGIAFLLHSHRLERWAGIAVVLTIFVFFIHKPLHLEPATVALAAA